MNSQLQLFSTFMTQCMNCCIYHSVRSKLCECSKVTPQKNMARHCQDFPGSYLSSTSLLCGVTKLQPPVDQLTHIHTPTQVGKCTHTHTPTLLAQHPVWALHLSAYESVSCSWCSCAFAQILHTRKPSACNNLTWWLHLKTPANLSQCKPTTFKYGFPKGTACFVVYYDNTFRVREFLGRWNDWSILDAGWWSSINNSATGVAVEKSHYYGKEMTTVLAITTHRKNHQWDFKCFSYISTSLILLQMWRRQ